MPSETYVIRRVACGLQIFVFHGKDGSRTQVWSQMLMAFNESLGPTLGQHLPVKKARSVRLSVVPHLSFPVVAYILFGFELNKIPSITLQRCHMIERIPYILRSLFCLLFLVALLSSVCCIVLRSTVQRGLIQAENNVPFYFTTTQ